NNVVVLMMDRAYSGYIPYFFEEKPELREQFDGFTYYPNTLSFGKCTNYGVPPVFGGYEYTPVEMNKRENDLLRDKHNEAAKLMPALFYEENYEVTVSDITFANFKNIPDLTIYDEYEGMNKLHLRGRFLETERFEAIIDSNYRNFFCFSLVKTVPTFFQNMLYYMGNYSQASHDYSPQIIRSGYLEAYGSSYEFVEDYSVLDALPQITVCSEEDTDTFFMLCNETCHDGVLLQLPDYKPTPLVDNSDLDYSNEFYEFAVNRDKRSVLTYYHVNMAAMLRLGEWFDYMRANDVYDNTRIIIVADHGELQPTKDSLYINDLGTQTNIGDYNPLLMVKDFNSTGFVTSDEFMTNADVPVLATNELINDPVNPFTGKAINSEEKYAHKQFVVPLNYFNVESSDGEYTQYWPSQWFSVGENIFDHSNWTFYEEETALPQAALN
ncbi:MAG: hypothetical protein IJ364_02150, partial [Oscillospiraceae bacterium]|nr:hypothetical protein [Oscillospiraceae bacterium]